MNELPIDAAPTLADVMSRAEGERLGRVNFAPRPVVPAAPAAPRAAPSADLVVEAREPAVHHALDLAGLDLDEVVTAMVRTMAEARDARLRHEESLVAETQRRCELIEAQAALDAELTLLMARRHAHAVLAAAGADQDPATEAKLEELVATASRMLHSIGGRA